MRERPPFPFVVGCGRSGTTLVQALLDAHHSFAVPFESYFPVWFARHLGRYERPEGFALATFLDDVLAHESFRRWNLDPEWARAAIEADAPATYADAVRACFAAYARAQGKPRYADKTPIFISSIPLLAGLFPEAVFVHLVRDGRDVALSRGGAAWGTHRPDLELLVWRTQIERGRRAGTALGPARYREIHYEALVDDAEAVARELCEFVQTDFDPGMLQYHDRVGQILESQPFPEDHQNLWRPPTKLRDWRTELTPAQVELFEALAGPTLRRFGYETSTARVPASVHARATAARARYTALTQYRRGRSALWRATHGAPPVNKPERASGEPVALGATYNADFYELLDSRVRNSAAAVVPIVVDLLHPGSVLDVGCGRGTWLHVFTERGVTDIVGVDGPHISPGDLEIPRESFVGHDLTQPLDLGRRFDLAVSLEVAEHLPPAVAPAFVASIVAHAPVVLFSAAIPFQGGAGHVNERWPSYWADLFATHGFVPVDAVRPLVWANDQVAPYYAQNALLYVDRNHPDFVVLHARGINHDWPLDVVHPALFERARTGPASVPSLRRALHDVRGAAWRAVRRRVSRRP